MTAEEFNNLTTTYAKELLYPLGFKQSGIHFYIHNKPNIMVLYKKTFRGMFVGFFLAVTHDFFANTIDNKGKLKIPVYLEDYPFSISLSALEGQYAKHKTVTDFSYDTNYLTKEVISTRQFTKIDPNEIIAFDDIQIDSQKAIDYIKLAVDTTITGGLKLLDEYSPVVSYHAVTRHKNLDNTILNKHKTELEKYFADNKIQTPKGKTGWFGNFSISNSLASGIDAYYKLLLTR